MSWHNVGTLDNFVINSGVCALVNNQQVALFYLPDTKQKIFAVSNYDPIGKANVLSRGIIGSLAEKYVVASPLYKQHFCLETGQCLEMDAISIATYSVYIEDSNVFVSAQPNVCTRSVA